MFSTSHALHSTTWLKEWQTLVDSEPIDQAVPSSLRTRLLDPLKAGDPVFSTILARHLVQSEEHIDRFIRVLTISLHSPTRILLCEIIFYLCKCTAVECRLFMASVLPALLYAEWVLGGGHCPVAALQNEKPAESLQLEDDLAAIEVAILAAYQQDYNINPLPSAIRIPPLSQPSIYHVRFLYHFTNHR